jgi:hypothetical protein
VLFHGYAAAAALQVVLCVYLSEPPDPELPVLFAVDELVKQDVVPQRTFATMTSEKVIAAIIVNADGSTRSSPITKKVGVSTSSLIKESHRTLDSRSDEK